MFSPLKFLAISSLSLFSATAIVEAKSWETVTLNVTQIDVSRGGLVHVLVFLKDGFPIKHDKALKSYFKPTEAEHMTFRIDVPADVPFAIKAHHDEDGNNRVTKNWTGVFPAEGFAFSSGAKMELFPPTFAAAKMSLPQDANVSIQMRYP